MAATRVELANGLRNRFSAIELAESGIRPVEGLNLLKPLAKKRSNWAVRPTAEVVGTDPLRVEIPIEHDGDVLVLTLDEGASVVGERHE